MIPSTIPWFVPRWLLGFPQLITLMLAGLTRLRRIKRLRVKLLLVAVALLLCAVIAVWLVTHQRVAPARSHKSNSFQNLALCIWHPSRSRAGTIGSGFVALADCTGNRMESA